MTAQELRIGDPVWAKMKGYPPWPAKITDPPPNAKAQKNKHFVFFFGSNNNAWIPDENISLHNEQQLLNSANKKKSAALQNAIDVLVTYAKSYKKKKPSPLPKVKSSEKNQEKKPHTKVVKFTNSPPKKLERSVVANKSHAKGKKRPWEDLNGNATHSPSKSAMLLPKKSILSDISPYIPFLGEDLTLDQLPKNPKLIKPSKLHFGFIGMGVMGKHMVKTLLQSGHNISVWSKTPQQCDMALIFGAKRATYPADLIVNCDVTFCCVSEPDATKAVIFGEHGIIVGLIRAHNLGAGRKGFVNMTNTDPVTSNKLSETIAKHNGYYLEAFVWGSSLDAVNGTLIIIAAGDKIVFANCETCFHAIGTKAYFISCNIGLACKVSLALNALFGTLCASVAEVLVIVERLKMSKDDFFDCLLYGNLFSTIAYEKAKMMNNLSFKRVSTLKHVQKSLDLALAMTVRTSVPMPICVAANENYKSAKMRKIAEEDVCAVYKVIKF